MSNEHVIVTVLKNEGFHWGSYAVYYVDHNGNRHLEGTFETEGQAYDHADAVEKRRNLR